AEFGVERTIGPGGHVLTEELPIHAGQLRTLRRGERLMGSVRLASIDAVAEGMRLRAYASNAVRADWPDWPNYPAGPPKSDSKPFPLPRAASPTPDHPDTAKSCPGGE